MLLLLLLGAGNQAPIVDGVRAYATVSYAAVNPTESALSLVNSTTDSVTATTNAVPSEG